MYGKSAIGLADSLDIPATTEDLMNHYPEETETFLKENESEMVKYLDDYYQGKNTKMTRRMFLKEQHSQGNYLPQVITGDDLVQRFYGAFPNIHSTLVDGAESAAKSLNIRTPDIFSRARYFGVPSETKEEKGIIRKAMNFPIQATAANMTKYALVLCKRYIDQHDLNDTVKFFLPIHDELIFAVKEEFAEQWLDIQIGLMEKAGEFVLENTLQKAEGQVSDVWVK